MPNGLPQLKIGNIEINPPVVLAPMAGVTNPPFRKLCRRFGAGLYVSEMITARALVEKNPKTLHLATFDPEEQPRSIQLYGVDPDYIERAVTYLVSENRVDHIDLNFGCPVRKVTRKGGGAAIPAKPNLLRAILRAAISSSRGIPVTMKFRIGIDENITTYLDAGRIGEDEGCAAVALHARTAAQLYDGEAQWSAIAKLKKTVTSIPVLGNGDIWEAKDALRMMSETKCDGVVVGRGCLGRPWLFKELSQIFKGQEIDEPPTFGEVAAIMTEHAELLVSWQGERSGIRSFRKHATWYTKGFSGSSSLRERLCQVETISELKTTLSKIDPHEPFPRTALRVPRGKRGGKQKVALPLNFLENRFDASPSQLESLDISSGG